MLDDTRPHRRPKIAGITQPDRYLPRHMTPLLPEQDLTVVRDRDGKAGLRTWAEACRLLDDQDRAAMLDEVAESQTRSREFARWMATAFMRPPGELDVTQTALGEFL